MFFSYLFHVSFLSKAVTKQSELPSNIYYAMSQIDSAGEHPFVETVGREMTGR